MCLDKQGDIMYKKKMCSYYVFSLSLHKLGLPSKQVFGGKWWGKTIFLVLYVKYDIGLEF